jgi:osmotically inducible protein OsmC
MVTRTSHAEWQGKVPEGEGSVSLGSGALHAPYSFSSRFENGAGTNPEELIAAAHAACFSMALSLMLTKAGTPPTSIKTTASVKVEKDGDGFTVTEIALTTRGEVPGLDDAGFKTHAEAAKKGCPISKALAAVPSITLDAALA